VLLICQSDDTLGALAAILQQAGETGLTAQTARDAWECIKAGAVGCVVVDITSAATDALVLFRAARSSAQACNIPFLFLVSSESKSFVLDAFGDEVAPDEWLALPCTADEFLKPIRHLLDYRTSSGRYPAQPLPQTALNTTKASGSGGRAAVQPDDLLNAKGSIFAGQLGVLDVTKILSMVEPLRLTGVLKLADSKRYGQVYFVEGAVRHAHLHDIEGPDALFLLFHLKTGAFRFDLEAATTKRTIVGNTMALLLEGLRQMDEAKAMIKAFQQPRAAAAGAPAAMGS
jgi:hypothetical protein